MENNNKKASDNYEELIKIALYSSKNHVQRHFRSLSLGQQQDLLEWTATKTVDQFYLKLRNDAENLAR